MSVEFVEPEGAAVAGAPGAATVTRPSALPGRLLAGATGLAAGLAGVALTQPLYTVVRTASIIDFDRTVTLASRLPVDAFGDASPVRLDPAEGVAQSGTGATVTVPDGIDYGRWWLGLAAVLLLVAVWAAGRPRSRAPGAAVAALGGLLLGSAGAAWLAIRTTAGRSVPQIRFAAEPTTGLWLLVAAGALALLGGLLHAARPPLRRLLPRRRAG